MQARWSASCSSCFCPKRKSPQSRPKGYGPGVGRTIVKTIKLLVVLGLTVATFAVLARFVVHGRVNGASLHDSITAAAPSAGRLLGDDDECEPGVDTRTWRCSIVDRDGSGGADYVVTVEAGGSCWRAQLERDYSESGMPKRVRGCVYLWQWSLLDLL